MSMNNAARRRFRLARRVHEALQAARQAPREPPWPSVLWDRCQKLRVDLQHAERRGWPAASASLNRQLTAHVDELHDRLAASRQWLHQRRAQMHSMDASDVYRDLVALEREFFEVGFDADDGELFVVTEPIALEGVELGRFELRLALARPASSTLPLRVLPLEPCFAGGGDSVPHPHVNGDALCAGDGLAPLQSAWREGRLFDFFLIALRVLSTYNPDSAYVALEDWHGEPCPECDDVVASDERTCCRACGKDLCCQCAGACVGCDESLCRDCQLACAGCDDVFCSRCLADCVGCGAPFCQECLNDESTCKTCQEADATAADDSGPCDSDRRVADAPQTASAPLAAAASAAAVHAVCVGQTHLSA